MTNTEIYNEIVQHYNLEELKNLCFRLNVNYDDLAGEGRAGKIRELVLFCDRQLRLPQLEAELARERDRRSQSTSPPTSNTDRPGNDDMTHDLHQYPRGPLVDAFRVRRSIKQACADAIDPDDAMAFINEANAFRMEANEGDSSVTIIKPSTLPPSRTSRPTTFWEEAFGQACLHGPRMLAALLLSLPIERFPPAAVRDRDNLLASLRDN